MKTNVRQIPRALTIVAGRAAVGVVLAAGLIFVAAKTNARAAEMNRYDILCSALGVRHVTFGESTMVLLPNTILTCATKPKPISFHAQWSVDHFYE